MQIVLAYQILPRQIGFPESTGLSLQIHREHRFYSPMNVFSGFVVRYTFNIPEAACFSLVLTLFWDSTQIVITKSTKKNLPLSSTSRPY